MTTATQVGCPSWCIEGHGAADHSRFHFSQQRTFRGRYARRGNSADLVQVDLELNPDDGLMTVGGDRCGLAPAEARALAFYLLAVADVAEGPEMATLTEADMTLAVSAWHGTKDGYRRYGCACGPCTTANAETSSIGAQRRYLREHTGVSQTNAERCRAYRERWKLRKAGLLEQVRESKGKQGPAPRGERCTRCGIDCAWCLVNADTGLCRDCQDVEVAEAQPAELVLTLDEAQRTGTRRLDLATRGAE